MDSPEDLAKGIAEDIGVMPIVTGASKMGGGLMDLISMLMSGGKQAGAPAPRMAQPPAVPNAPPAAQPGAPAAQAMGGQPDNNFMQLLLRLLQMQK